jgi:hypothetical protein
MKREPISRSIGKGDAETPCLEKMPPHRLLRIPTIASLATGMLCSLALATGSAAQTAAAPDHSVAEQVQGTASGAAAHEGAPQHAVKVRKNERLNHCKSMSGDEKKACQDEADALAKSERQATLHSHRTGTSRP